MREAAPHRLLSYHDNLVDPEDAKLAGDLVLDLMRYHKKLSFVHSGTQLRRGVQMHVGSWDPVENPQYGTRGTVFGSHQAVGWLTPILDIAGDVYAMFPTISDKNYISIMAMSPRYSLSAHKDVVDCSDSEQEVLQETVIVNLSGMWTSRVWTQGVCRDPYTETLMVGDGYRLVHSSDPYSELWHGGEVGDEPRIALIL